jgi:hypothetical protein
MEEGCTSLTTSEKQCVFWEAQLISYLRIFLYFMNSQSSLQNSKETTIHPYLEPKDFTHILFPCLFKPLEHSADDSGLLL